MKRSCDDFFAKDGILCAKVDACNADASAGAGTVAYLPYTDVKNLQIANKTELLFDANNFTKQSLTIIKIATSCIGTVDAFDEEFLANLRDKLKTLENCDPITSTKENGESAQTEGAQNGAQNAIPALVAIDFDALQANSEDAIEIIYHTTRRIKDCKCICGVVLPLSCSVDFAQNLILRLAKKHPEYVYFVQNSFLYGALCEQFAGRIVRL